MVSFQIAAVAGIHDAWTLVEPWAPQTQLVRTMVDPGRHSSSPASLDRPYTEVGHGGSHSR